MAVLVATAGLFVAAVVAVVAATLWMARIFRRGFAPPRAAMRVPGNRAATQSDVIEVTATEVSDKQLER